MKKLLCVLLALTVVLALAACGGEETKVEDKSDSKTDTTVGSEPTVPEETDGEEEMKTPEDTEVQTGTKPAPDVDEVTNPVEDDTVLYTVKVVDEAGNAVTSATLVQICDETCVPVKLTDGEGTKTLPANPNYHVELTSGLPEGYEYATEETVFSFDENNVCTIVLKTVA